MRRITTLLLLLAWFSNAKAQDYKVVDSCSTMFTYSYQFYDEHKNPGSVKMQEMVLEVGKKCSKFYSTYRQYTDSLFMLSAGESSDVAFSTIRSKTMNMTSYLLASFYVYKNYPEPDVALFTAWDTKVNHYKVEERLAFNWHIESNVKKEIAGYSCTKATCTFAGRSYEAWFTTQIPINDGPYKFSGLPGLIVKLSDTDSEHVFELQNVVMVKNKPMYFVDRKYADTDAKAYVKALEASKAESVKRLGSYSYSDDAMRMRAISNAQRRNNFIERY